MSKAATIWEKLYFQPLYPDVARLIGYAGIEPSAFWEAAKELKEKHGEQKVMSAINELTRYDRREASPPRYELNAEARKWCLQLLGPPPEHPLRDFLKHGPSTLMGEDAEKWEAEYRAKLKDVQPLVAEEPQAPQLGSAPAKEEAASSHATEQLPEKSTKQAAKKRTRKEK